MTNKRTNNTEPTTNHEKLTAFLNRYLKVILTSAVGVILIVGVSVGVIFFREYKISKELDSYQKLVAEFETKLMDISKKYQSENEDGSVADNSALENEKNSAIIDYAVKLSELTEKSHWGYVSHNGFYIAGGLYFTVKNYDKALECYLKAAKNVNNDVFEMLALQQAGACYEWLGKNDDALKTYENLEKKFKKSHSLDRIYYDLGRMYQVNGDKEKAKDYFSRVIKSYSSSVFAKKSQERILLLGAK